MNRAHQVSRRDALASMTVATMDRTSGSRSATALGVNARCTGSRRRVCTGGSRKFIQPLSNSTTRWKAGERWAAARLSGPVSPVIYAERERADAAAAHFRKMHSRIGGHDFSGCKVEEWIEAIVEE